MRVNERGIPTPSDRRTVDHWLVGRAAFRGTGHILLPDGTQSAEPSESTLLGTVACFTDGEHLCAVLSKNKGDLGVWLRVPLGELTVEAKGTKGFRTKRPEKLHLRGPGWELLASEIDSLNLARMRSTAGQEAALLQALTAEGQA